MRAFLILAFILLAAIALTRPPEYDEAYSMFLTAGDPRPAWPAGIFTPAQVQNHFSGHASLAEIARNLRVGDVHPPLYFWTLELWRRTFGPAWFTARLLSVLCATASLWLLGLIARAEKIPVIPALLICLLAYGFTYTSCIARGFALAQLFNLAGLALLTRQSRPTRHSRESGNLLNSFTAGLAFSAASFTNYLAIFTALGTLITVPRHAGEGRHPRLTFLAGLATLLTKTRHAGEGRHPRLPSFPTTPKTFDSRAPKPRHCEERSDEAILLPAFLLGLAIFVPAGLYFFAAQHASRPGQFTTFSLPHALALLAKDQAAALYGGLPLYAPATLLPLAILSLIITWHLIKNPSRYLLIAAATPAGLLTLGLIFHNTPIEIRYCAFAIPPLALALAQALKPVTRNILIGIQALAIAGLAFAPATMQPQGRAARAIPPGSLALIPFGNDGVGIPGPFIEAARPNQRILIIRGPALPDLESEQTLTLAWLPLDNQSKTILPIIKSELAATRPLTRQTATTLTYGQSRSHQQP